jgi:hypothetical protein
MIDTDRFVKALKDSGVDFFTGVPDSLLKPFCAYVTDTCGGSHVIAANEGGAIGLSAIAESCGYNRPGSPVFREIRVAKGARGDLGRPKEPPQANKALFMRTLA